MDDAGVESALTEGDNRDSVPATAITTVRVAEFLSLF